MKQVDFDNHKGDRVLHTVVKLAEDFRGDVLELILPTRLETLTCLATSSFELGENVVFECYFSKRNRTIVLAYMAFWGSVGRDLGARGITWSVFVIFSRIKPKAIC